MAKKIYTSMKKSTNAETFLKLSDYIDETVFFVENADVAMSAVLEAVEFYGESDEGSDINDIELKFRGYKDTVTLSRDTGIAVKSRNTDEYVAVRDDSDLFDKAELLFFVMDYGQ